MEEIIKFLDKVLEALRTESKFKGDFKGHRVIVTNYNDQFAFYVDNHVVRDIPRVELVEMYLKQALSEIVLGKKVMDSNPITQWLIDNKVPFVERVMDSKGARTLILFPHTTNEAWLNLRRVKDVWNCEGQSTKFQRLEDSSTGTHVLNVVKSYVYSAKDRTGMNLKKLKDSRVKDSSYNYHLQVKVDQICKNVLGYKYRWTLMGDNTIFIYQTYDEDTRKYYGLPDSTKKELIKEIEAAGYEISEVEQNERRIASAVQLKVSDPNFKEEKSESTSSTPARSPKKSVSFNYWYVSTELEFTLCAGAKNAVVKFLTDNGIINDIDDVSVDYTESGAENCDYLIYHYDEGKSESWWYEADSLEEAYKDMQHYLDRYADVMYDDMTEEETGFIN